MRLGNMTKKQSGFTLLEILIAVLILAIGLLGFAALQISAVNAGQEGYFRSQALLVAESLADKIRANRDYANWENRANATGGAVADNNLYGETGGTLYTCAAVPNPFCSDNEGADGVLCNQQEVAAFDVFTSCANAAQILPDGLVTVVCSDADELSAAFDDKPNPYVGLSHPNFVGTPAILPNVADGDNCSPMSRYSIFVGWRANDVRMDTGELSQSLTARCQQAAPAGPGFAAGIQCVLLEVIP